MKSRTFIGVVPWLICAGLVWGLVAQHGQLTTLRAEREKLAEQANGAMDSGGSAGEPAAGAAAQESKTTESSAEVLRLRNEVTQLTARKQAMSGVRAENEKLKVQVAMGGTNAQSGIALPPGYLRKSDAVPRGYNSPQATLESFLWAIQNHDFTNLLQAVTPKFAEHLINEHGTKSPEDFFKGAEHIPGINVLSERTLADGKVELEVEIVPGVPSGKIQFEQVNGQWRMGAF